jgi:hypothetical protein
VNGDVDLVQSTDDQIDASDLNDVIVDDDYWARSATPVATHPRTVITIQTSTSTTTTHAGAASAVRSAPPTPVKSVSLSGGLTVDTSLADTTTRAVLTTGIGAAPAGTSVPKSRPSLPPKTLTDAAGDAQRARALSPSRARHQSLDVRMLPQHQTLAAATADSTADEAEAPLMTDRSHHRAATPPEPATTEVRLSSIE